MKIAVYILVGLIILIFVLFFILGLKSQKGQALGVVDGKLALCSSKPNCVSSEEGAPKAARISAFTSANWDDLKAAILAHGGKITKDDNGYLSAEFSSSLFKFVDDVELRLDGEQLHVRSSSRVGYSDRGVNRARIEALRAAL